MATSCHLCSCKRWNSIGHLIAWTALKITSNSLENFVASTILNRERYRRCKHLTVRLHAPFPPLCDCGADWFDEDIIVGQNHPHRQDDHHDDTTHIEIQKLLKLLALIIEQKVTSLGTFSFAIDNEPQSGYWCGHKEPSVSIIAFDNLLRSVPPTCVNLELDTGGTDFSCVQRNEHLLCAQVRRLLPQRHNLRLRAAHICPGCVPSHSLTDQVTGLGPCAPLKSLASCTINLITYPREIRAAFCGGYTGPGKMSPATDHRVAIEVAKVFRNAVQAGSLPAVRSLGIFDSTPMTGTRYYDPFDDTVDVDICRFGDIDSVLHFDVLRNRTTSFPFDAFDENVDYENLRMRDFPCNILNRRYLVGSLANFEDVLEGTWIISSDGLRLPKSFQMSQEGEQNLNLTS